MLRSLPRWFQQLIRCASGKYNLRFPSFHSVIFRLKNALSTASSAGFSYSRMGRVLKDLLQSAAFVVISNQLHLLLTYHAFADRFIGSRYGVGRYQVIPLETRLCLRSYGG